MFAISRPISARRWYLQPVIGERSEASIARGSATGSSPVGDGGPSIGTLVGDGAGNALAPSCARPVGLPAAIRRSGRWSACHGAMPARGGTGSAWNQIGGFHVDRKSLYPCRLRDAVWQWRVGRESEGTVVTDHRLDHPVSARPRRPTATAHGSCHGPCAGGTWTYAMRTDLPVHPDGMSATSNRPSSSP